MERTVFVLCTLTVLLWGSTEVINVKAHTCTDFSWLTKCLILLIQNQPFSFLEPSPQAAVFSASLSYQPGPSLAFSPFLTPPQYGLYTPQCRQLGCPCTCCARHVQASAWAQAFFARKAPQSTWKPLCNLSLDYILPLLWSLLPPLSPTRLLTFHCVSVVLGIYFYWIIHTFLCYI